MRLYPRPEWRLNRLYLWCPVIAVFVLTSCFYTPPPMSLTPEPIPVRLADLLLRLEDFPIVDTGAWTGDTLVIGRELPMEAWRWSGASDATEMFYDVGNSAYESHQVIVRYSEPIGAAGAWNAVRNSTIDHELIPVPHAPPMTEDDLPALHAHQVALLCDTYWPDAPWFHCAARMQYGLLFTQIDATIAKDGLSPAQFSEILQAADERMRPIWDELPGHQ